MTPPLRVVVVPELAAVLAAAPWRPPTGAGIEIGQVHGHGGVAIICAHGMLADRIAGALDAVSTWERLNPACAIEWVRYYFEPPEAMADAFAVSTKPDAPAALVGAIGSLNVIAASVRAFIEDNPPAACGCDPGIELVFRLGSPEPAMLRLCHETSCAHVGKAPARQRMTLLSPRGGVQ